MLPFLLLETRAADRHPRLATSIVSRSSSARASVGAAATYPSLKRIANASSSTSTVPSRAVPFGAARAASAAAGAPPTTSTSLDMAPASASRYVSRASSGSSDSRRLAAFTTGDRLRRCAAARTRSGRAIARPGLARAQRARQPRRLQQPERSLQIAGIPLRAGGREQPLCAVLGLGRERGGALEEGRDGRQPATGLRSSGGTLQLGGEILVGPRTRPARRCHARRSGSSLRIGRLGERAVDRVRSFGEAAAR